MTHNMPQLPYAMDALAPLMSQETLEYHYGKHLQTYVNNLNNLIKGTEFENLTLEEIVKKSEGGIFNNAAQAWNHAVFFCGFSPVEKNIPANLAERLVRDFGSVEAFKEAFGKAAAGVFGSGWTWLAEDAEGKLMIKSYSNAGNPLPEGLNVIFGLDVWEHSYYIDYRNNRLAYIDAFWKLLDWEVAAKRLLK
ncbi:MAG: superoxide dismutase [Phocaeicola sp.]|nr:superoxide dismutase [Phocaeicola sp.]MDD7447634.1 superoxide dismutase [Prevotellaceae bacterium]MDY3913555.1 superoxide dismutase [Phocaeicola sp.]MDY5938312.1 superoxide dismutase [Phocaeicola sp.]